MPTIKTVTATKFQQSVGEYGDLARKEPVIVTRHNRPWFVVLDPDEYERLKEYDSRTALYPHELNEALKAELEEGYQGRPTPELDHLLD